MILLRRRRVVAGAACLAVLPPTVPVTCCAAPGDADVARRVAWAVEVVQARWGLRVRRVAGAADVVIEVRPSGDSVPWHVGRDGRRYWLTQPQPGSDAARFVHFLRSPVALAHARALTAPA